MTTFNQIPHGTITTDAHIHFPKGFNSAELGTQPIKINSTTMRWIKGNIIYNANTLNETISVTNDSDILFPLFPVQINTDFAYTNGEFTSFFIIFQFKHSDIAPVTFSNYFEIICEGFYTYNSSVLTIGENYKIEYIGDDDTYYKISGLGLDISIPNNPKLTFDILSSLDETLSYKQIINIIRN